MERDALFIGNKTKQIYKIYRKVHDFRTLNSHMNKYAVIPRQIVHRKPIKRVSRFISPGWAAKSPEGSMTVEAALAVPLFLFFMVNVLSILLFFHRFSTNLEELHQQGRQLSMLAYTARDTGIIQDEMVKLVKPVRVSPVIPVLGYRGTTIVSCCYMRAWTGYDVTQDEVGETEEEYVYITESGSVYHRRRNCTHLSLSVELTGREEVESRRNAYGGRYTACEKCKGSESGIVYITAEGDRYHNTIECSGLKRTVRCVLLSETGGRAPCSRCG